MYKDITKGLSCTKILQQDVMYKDITTGCHV